MPMTTPQIKIDSVAALGATVVLEGDSYDDAYAEAMRIVRRRKLTFVHPYDDPDVIAGQGTIAMEILRQFREPIDTIFVAVGGGGLIGGIAAYVKRLRPEIRIVGVEPEDANAMERSLRAGRRVTLPHVGLFADGVAVKQVGVEPFRLARRYVDEMILVDTDELCAAMKDVFEDTRAIVEPSAALGVAGVKRHVEQHGIGGRNLVTVLCGANMNFDRLRFVAERADLGEAREAVFAATIPERPGSFKEFCRLLGRSNITEFNYRFGDPAEAHVFVGLSVRDHAEKDRLLRSIGRAGIRTLDLTDNELAKLHVRHLVGGPAKAPNEVLYRFEFPERPGALMRFLDAMSQGLNISLFHYRNHGADYGRVLAGIQVPPGERRAFKDSLRKLGYPYVEETGQPGGTALPRRLASVSRRRRRTRGRHEVSTQATEEPCRALDHPDHPARCCSSAASATRGAKPVATPGEGATDRIAPRVEPPSTCSAHWRPSLIAHTTSDWPRRASPAAKTPSTDVAYAGAAALPRASRSTPSCSSTSGSGWRNPIASRTSSAGRASSVPASGANGGLPSFCAQWICSTAAVPRPRDASSRSRSRARRPP